MLYSRVIAFLVGLMRRLLLYITGRDYLIWQYPIFIWFTSYFAYPNVFQDQRIAFRLFDPLSVFCKFPIHLADLERGRAIHLNCIPGHSGLTASPDCST